jgi:hypothetical protein
MWIVVARRPLPDAPYWPGRRCLAAVDALVWPFLWAVVFWHAPVPVGIVGHLIAALATLSATGRLRRALWFNHRYQFTSWRWGRAMVALLLVGATLKFGMSP